jgi:transcriptional regulator GlxA family with amidase domain
MCLHLIRRDHGQAIAARAARLAVAPLSRDGGQAQFIRHEPPQSTDSLAPVLEWMGANLNKEMDVDSLARRARTSPRTFARRFRDQTGTTPLQWLLAARVRRAQELLETSRRPIDDIALRCGFESSITFRARFRKLVGLNPSAFRQRFAASPGSK